MNIAILGAMWGDEGKGHITHHLSKDYDWVIRFNGGANAGHTIYRDGKKYVHNLLPSIDWRAPDAKAYLGAGMVIDLEKLRDEVRDAEAAFPGSAKRVYVDKNAFIVLNEHKEEDKKKNGHIGSTNRGIGPAYGAKIGRRGVRIDDLLRNHIDSVINELRILGVHFVDLLEVRDEMTRGKLLYEGAQGVLLDINHGIYPYVSCSDCTIGGIYSAGFHFAPPKRIYGVAKCYTTKVGEGPFPTEISGEEAEALRKRGNEYGATTGRPRRVGWLDLPALNYACKVSGITDLILTKFDILAGMDKVPVAIKYDKMPTSPADFHKSIPEYTELPGWAEAKKGNKELHNFIRAVEKATGCNVNYISVGTETTDILPWYG
jgi:adenylosuccinate synthase